MRLEKTSGVRKVVKKTGAPTAKKTASTTTRKVVKGITIKSAKIDYNLPTERKYARRKFDGAKKKKHVPKLRKSLTPGTICIVLSSRHRGKRVVLLKQMEQSGMCLVTGPYMLNGCPVRRICQSLLLATSLKLDVSKLKLPQHMDDRYFAKKRPSRKSTKSGKDGDIFEVKKTGYELTEQRRADQKAVDAQVKVAIEAHHESSPLLCAYLAKPFQLRRGMYPHKIHF